MTLKITQPVETSTIPHLSMSDSQYQGNPYIMNNSSDQSAGKVFIGGLSCQTSEEGLRYYFEKFGELVDVALMSDKRTGQPRGFGFVTFKDPAGEN
jgi:RNA recognition motif-containing protein